MRIKSGCLHVIFSSLIGCSSVDLVGHLDDHPEFSPLVPRNGKTEYQVAWYRSWKPIIYLKAYIEQDKYSETKRAFVYYSTSMDKVETLKKIEITMESWKSIVNAIDQSSLWRYESKCDQLSYQKRSIYFQENNECTEVFLTDGATITIAASEPGRAIGITTVCNNLDLCEPLGDIPLAILRTIGKENEAK